MPIRLPSLRGVIKWPRTATAVIATSGLIIVLVAVSRRIWRGGGKKAKDPDGTDSSRKSQENIDKENKIDEKKNSDSEKFILTSKGKEFLEEKEELLKETALIRVNVATENKHVLTENPDQIVNVAKETCEAVKTRPNVLTENPQFQPKSPKEIKTEVTVHNKPIAFAEKTQPLAIVPEEIKTKLATIEPDISKPDTLTEILKSQQKASRETKIVVTTQEKSVVLEDRPQAQPKVIDAVQTKCTTQIKPGVKEKPVASKEQETDIKVRPPTKELEVEIANSNLLLSSIVKGHTPKNDAGKNAKPVNGVNQEPNSLVKTNKSSSPTSGVEHQIFFVEKNWVSFFPTAVTSTTENLNQGGTLQSVGEGNGPGLNGTVLPKKEVVELYNQTKLIPQSKEIVPELTSNSTQIEGTAINLDNKTLGEALESEAKPSNHPEGAVKELESNSFSSPKVEKSVELVKDANSDTGKVPEVQLNLKDSLGINDKQLNSISPSTVEETVKRVNSVISDSGKTLAVQLKSLDSLESANEKLKDCSASLKKVNESVQVINPVDIRLRKPCDSNYIDNTDNHLRDCCTLKPKQTRETVNSVISETEKLLVDQSKSSNILEGDDTQLKNTPTTEELVEAVISLENQPGHLQHIPVSISGPPKSSNKQLRDISVSSSRTERSVVTSPEREKVVKSKLVAKTSVFPEDGGERACEESELSKEQEVSDTESSEAGELGQGEEESVCKGTAVREETLVVAVSTKEPATLKEKVTKLCVVESGSSALGDQVKVVTVQPSCTAGAALTEKVEECAEVKDLSKESEKNSSNSPDSTLPKKEEGELINKEVTTNLLEKSDMLTKGAEAKSDMAKGKSSGGKRKGKKGKKMLDEEEVAEMVEKMEVKDIMRESEESILQNSDVGEHNSGKPNQVHASGISSPSIPNFPDNRSEGSSCGDSGKGRSDVTTPGGLEEDLREVNFAHHFSPPCSTSGPEEEEEDRVRRDSGSTAEDGSQGEIGSAIGGEEIVRDEAVVVGSDGLVIPVPVPIYHGMVPVTPPPSVYEFVIPQGLVGRLIGKHGSFVNLIKARTSATIFIKTHPETNKLKVCAIEGTDEEIQAALDMVREKFPLRRYTSMTLEQVFFLPLPPPTFTLIPDSLPLQLVEGVSNDVILSALMSPSHYFLQQPTHPTYPTLAKLDMWMAMCYQDANAPMLPEDVKAGIICAAPTMGGWYRAQIVAVEELPSTPEDEPAEDGELIKWCDVRFVDYGGYERMPSHSLRQIRSDFMTLPFQASECYLASVIPAPSDENKMADEWSMEAYALVEELTQAQVLKAQVVGHATDGLPLVLLYAFSHSYGQVVQVNNELVNRGLAIWAVPLVETDQALPSGSENISGDEIPPENLPETEVA